MRKIQKVATVDGVDLYDRGLVVEENERKELGLEEGTWVELFPVEKIPLFSGDILKKGKRNWAKVK